LRGGHDSVGGCAGIHLHYADLGNASPSTGDPTRSARAGRAGRPPRRCPRGQAHPWTSRGRAHPAFELSARRYRLVPRLAHDSWVTTPRFMTGQSVSGCCINDRGGTGASEGGRRSTAGGCSSKANASGSRAATSWTGRGSASSSMTNQRRRTTVTPGSVEAATPIPPSRGPGSTSGAPTAPG